jgi:hypothetical protein
MLCQFFLSVADILWIHAKLILCFQLPDNVKSVLVLQTCIKSALVVAFAEQNNTIGVVHALGILCSTRSFLSRDQNNLCFRVRLVEFL